MLLRTDGANVKMPNMVESEEIVGDEWADWYRLTPLQRWHASGELWEHYLQIGGSLDPEPDTQSPFYGSRRKRNRGEKRAWRGLRP